MLQYVASVLHFVQSGACVASGYSRPSCAHLVWYQPGPATAAAKYSRCETVTWSLIQGIQDSTWRVGSTHMMPSNFACLCHWRKPNAFPTHWRYHMSPNYVSQEYIEYMSNFQGILRFLVYCSQSWHTLLPESLSLCHKSQYSSINGETCTQGTYV